MKRLEIRNRLMGLKTAALTMLLSASLMASAAVPASAAVTAALTAPTGLETVQRDDDELTLAWNPVAGAQGYHVYLYDTDTNGWLQVERTSGTHAEIDDLRSASVYKFKVNAYANGQDGAFSTEFSTATAPKDVDNLRVKAKTKSSVTLSWSAVRRADKYQVYKYNANTGSWKRLTTTTSTSCKATGLSSGTYYKFKVRPVTEVLGSRYYGDFEDIKVKTKSASGTSTSSGYIGTAKAKKIALEYAGVSASKADFIKASLDYDDGVRVYDVEFYAGDYEYEFEINARTGAIYDYDKDYRWDD